MRKLKVMVGIFLVISSFYIFPIMWANETDCAFCPNNCGGGFGVDSTPSLKPLIIEGAEQFYNGVSVFMDALKHYEGSNFIEAKVSFSNSATFMRAVNEIYKELHDESFNYEYDTTVINALKSFNYDEYQAVHNLLPTVFHKVKGFLKKGEIREVFKELEILSGKIAADIESITTFQVPAKEIIWRINQDITESILFGQYISEIFNQIK